MIELHDRISGNPILINVNIIACVVKHDECAVVFNICSEDDQVNVLESYDEVKSLIGKVVMVVS